MKRKGVRVMIALVLVCLLTGILGVYSASASTEIGLTYRLNNWGGVKIKTQSGFGGELLVEYHGSTSEDSTTSHLDFEPSVLYHFKGSSDTSLYVGIGYFFHKYTYENWTSSLGKQSGPNLFIGLEHFFGEKFSVDLRATAYFNTWKDTWDSSEDHGTYTGLYVDMGATIYR